MRRIPNYGEPIGELDGDDDQVDELELERVDLGQAFRDFVTIGKIGLAMHRATARSRHEDGVIDMVEVSPGIFAREPGRPRRVNPMSQIERLERAFDALRKGIG